MFASRLSRYSLFSLLLSSIKQDVGILSDDIISVSYFVHVTIIVTVPFLLFGVEAVGDVVAEVENTLVIHCRIELILEAMSFVIFHIFLHVNLKRKIDHIVNFAVHLHCCMEKIITGPNLIISYFFLTA